ncbi:cobalt-precorrin-6A reductase [Roseibium sp. AS2]|uniref:cobalt-precorrin-6A reductase n=1 Tax=Roseibium sp. AS2 TaxID=3135781 RepID=UPI003173A582
MPDHILLLAGTFEARQVAERLAAMPPGVRVTASFAGAVNDLPDLGVPTRVGGFGGPDGLGTYLKEEAVSLLIDATHPFAARMSRNAAAAAEATGVRLLRLERSPWRPEAGDDWRHFPTLDAAACALPPAARVFLSIGRKDVGQFTQRSDLFALARMIEPPGVVLPDHWRLILARPAQAAADEIELLETHRISHLVTKNSGGARSFAKIEAARQLNLPVWMIDRPHLPPADTVDSLSALLHRLQPYFVGSA